MNLEIPDDFHSDVDEEPFIECKVCHRDLNKGDVPYSIEKAFKRVDEERDITLFEIAICMPCAQKQSQNMSKESQEYMMRVMGNSSFVEKRQGLWETDWRHHWKSSCIFSDEGIHLNDEYHIVGHFQGSKIIQNMAPFVIGQDFLEKIQENLSAETKDEMDRFGEQFLGPDPTIRALLKDHQMIFV